MTILAGSRVFVDGTQTLCAAFCRRVSREFVVALLANFGVWAVRSITIWTRVGTFAHNRCQGLWSMGIKAQMSVDL